MNYSLKEISEKIDRPLRTIQNWFKDVSEAEIDSVTGARYFDENTIIEVLARRKIDFTRQNAQEKEIKEEVKEEEKTAQDDAPLRAEARQNDAPSILSLLEKQISFYQSQLEEKDRQISNLNASLSKTNDLLSQEQQLNLINQKRIEDLNNQLLLLAPKEDAITDNETIKEAVITPSNEIKTDNEKTKKSFWKRLFSN